MVETAGENSRNCVAKVRFFLQLDCPARNLGIQRLCDFQIVYYFYCVNMTHEICWSIMKCVPYFCQKRILAVKLCEIADWSALCLNPTMQRAGNKCNASGATGPKFPSPYPEISVLLSPQRMKVVGWGGQVHDLQMSGSWPRKTRLWTGKWWEYVRAVDSWKMFLNWKSIISELLPPDLPVGTLYLASAKTIFEIWNVILSNNKLLIQCCSLDSLATLNYPSTRTFACVGTSCTQ